MVIVLYAVATFKFVNVVVRQLLTNPYQSDNSRPTQAGKNSECIGEEGGRLVENYGVKQQRRPEHNEDYVDKIFFHLDASKALNSRLKLSSLSSKLLSAGAAVSATLRTYSRASGVHTVDVINLAAVRKS